MDSLIYSQSLKVRQTYILKRDTGFFYVWTRIKKHLSFVLFFYFMCASTLISLVYVDSQLQIIEISYELRENESEIRSLKINNNDVYSEITKLQSFDHLNDQQIMASLFSERSSI